MRRTHNNFTGDSNPNWNGGTTRFTNGYFYLYRPDHPRAMKSGYIKRANAVIESVLGRYLTEDEVVHHKNHIKSDDSTGNLELLTIAAHNELHASERRKPKRPRMSKSKSATPETVAIPPKRIQYPELGILRQMVSNSSLRKVAKDLGCSHVSIYWKLFPEKRPSRQNQLGPIVSIGNTADS
jgi:hypothetical protein